MGKIYLPKWCCSWWWRPNLVKYYSIEPNITFILKLFFSFFYFFSFFSFFFFFSFPNALSFPLVHKPFIICYFLLFLSFLSSFLPFPTPCYYDNNNNVWWYQGDRNRQTWSSCVQNRVSNISKSIEITCLMFCFPVTFFPIIL